MAVAKRAGKPRAAARSDLGKLIEAGLNARGEERGEQYTVLDLARDAGLDWSYVARVLRGERQPAREMVIQMVRPLAPLIGEDEALVAAGYAPQTTRLRELVRNLSRASAEQIARVELALGEWISEPAERKADQRGKEERDGKATAANP